MLGEYQRAEDVTRQRLYLETIERVFQSSNKIILQGSPSSNVLPYLPLDQIIKMRPPAVPPIPSAVTGPTVAPLQGASQ